MRLWVVAFALILAAGIVRSAPSFNSKGLVAVPDTSGVNNELLKSAQADKFLSLWFIYVLSSPVDKFGGEWTIFMPKNAGLPKGQKGFLSDKNATKEFLLRHVVTGKLLTLNLLPSAEPVTSLTGMQISFSSDKGRILVNGVPVSGEEITAPGGNVIIMEGYLSPLDKPVAKSLGPEPPSLTVNDHAGNLGHQGDNNEDFGITEVPSGVESEFFPSETDEFLPHVVSSQTPFLASLFRMKGHGGEFLYHLAQSHLEDLFYSDSSYTALLPIDDAFYAYYPIDWGFNPFTVGKFTRDVILNHFIAGDVILEDVQDQKTFKTLGGKIVQVRRNGRRLLVNDVDVLLETEFTLPRGRIYNINDILFVDQKRVDILHKEYPYYETPPLLGGPWPTSQFLSHLLLRTEANQLTTQFAKYLNMSNIAGFAPSFNDEIGSLTYSALIPTNKVFKDLFAEEGDPFLFSPDLRNELLLNHIVKGIILEEDMTDGIVLTNLKNETYTVTIHEGETYINDVRVNKFDGYLYDLGTIYIIDGLLLGNRNKASAKEFDVNSPALLIQHPPAEDIETTSAPEIRYEVRTEISITRKINDGEIERIL